jgi:two-component system, NarL family, invasion response regulator UvrY
MPDLPPGRADVGVVVVDDQPFFRDAVRAVLDTLVGFSAAGEASSGPEAVSVVAELRPELVLIDVRMPGMNGIEAARRIMAGHPETVVVLISTDDVTDAVSTARSCGAAAFVRKQDFGAASLQSLWAQHGRHLD